MDRSAPLPCMPIDRSLRFFWPEDWVFPGVREKMLNFRFIPTMTATDSPCRSWSGETGSISKEMLSKYLPRLQGAVCYVAG
jgi:hypothetical protein